MTAALAEQQRPVHLQAASLELRVAENAAEIEAAQALRYRVFYEELNAQPTPEMSALRRDFDSFDPYCDHLIIIDRAKGEGAAGIIATYRLMRREQASRHADHGEPVLYGQGTAASVERFRCAAFVRRASICRSRGRGGGGDEGHGNPADG
ncbi:MAG: GNAT family N-acetyltransferase [Sphingomonadales bacterium]|nr:GNAT family N-acetyltransferase [Sphingomonadales bacterium]